MITLYRKDKENINSKEKIQSVIKFEFIDNSKSKNINQNLIDNKMKLLAIDLFKKDNNSEIVLLFSNNQVITLSCEIIEVTLEDISEINDKNT